MDCIPSVVASESGAAQTITCVALMKAGLRVGRSRSIKECPLLLWGADYNIRLALWPSRIKSLVERFWNSRPKRVKVPYAKRIVLL